MVVLHWQDSSDREVATAAARALAGVVVAAHGAADLEARMKTMKGWTLEEKEPPQQRLEYHSRQQESISLSLVHFRADMSENIHMNHYETI